MEDDTDHGPPPEFQAREQNLFNEIYNSLSTEEKEAMGRLSFLAEQQK